MKIGTPQKELPDELRYGKRRGRWLVVWAHVNKLKDGQWLPVTCDDLKEAKSLYSAAHSNRPPFRCRRGGNVVWLSKIIPKRKEEIP